MRKYVAAAMIAGVSALALSACAMPADDPNWVSGGGAGGAGGASGAAGGGGTAADAAAIVAAALKAPTGIGVSAPLSNAPKPGATIAVLSDGSTYGAAVTAAITEAATTLKWKVTVVSGATTANAAPAAFAKAAAANPAGIVITGLQYEGLSAELASSKIPVVCVGCTADPSGALKDTSIDVKVSADHSGAVVASWINQNSKQDAVVEMFALGAPATQEFDQGLQTTLASYCVNCSTNENVQDPSNPVKPGDLVSQALLANPTATWVSFAPGDLAVAPDAAATAAGMSAVPKTAGAWPDPANLKAASTGKATGWYAVSVPITGWRVIDQFARILGGQPVATDQVPGQLITGTTSAPVLTKDGWYQGVADYQAQFKKLWGM